MRIDMPDPGSARSFWLQEALQHDPGEPCPPLDAHVVADVCIVGGGFAGLWTAVRLSEREPSLRIVLLEQDIVGGGASGRNGGFFSSSWWDLEALIGLYGEEEGVRYSLALADTVEEAEAFCAANGIDCWFHRDGALGVRAGTWQEGIGRDRAIELCDRLRLADRMVALTAAEARAYADSPLFLGGAFIRDAAVVQPARLARGLRRLLLDRGVRIYERSQVTGLERSIPAIVRTDHGAVRADHVVLTHGSWAAGWPEFRRSFAVVVDYVVVTEPIPEHLKEIGWTSHVGIGDGRGWLYYLRPTDDGRIAIGGGAGAVAYGGRANGRAVTHDRRVAEVAGRGLLTMFPQLEGTRFTHAWGGPIDMTASFVPFYRSLRPGTIHAGLGYSGHGLSQTYIGGKILASTVLGMEDEWTTLAVNRPERMKVPPEPVRWIGVNAIARALERGDVREEAGKPRGALNELVGSIPNVVRDRLVARS
jgi:glycine/D-amino acid oxidase-like deaminating enzyme